MSACRYDAFFDGEDVCLVLEYMVRILTPTPCARTPRAQYLPGYSLRWLEIAHNMNAAAPIVTHCCSGLLLAGEVGMGRGRPALQHGAGQDGGTLSDLIARKGPMPEQQLASLAVRATRSHAACACARVAGVRSR